MSSTRAVRPQAVSAETPAVPLTIEGYSVLHQMMRVRWPAWRELSAAQKNEIVNEASTALALHTLEQSAPLSGEQRAKLREVLLALPPPKKFGQMDQWVVLYRLSILSSQASVKAILEARQWQLLAQPLAQAKGYKQHLMDLGHTAEDLDVKPTLMKPALAKPAVEKSAEGNP